MYNKQRKTTQQVLETLAKRLDAVPSDKLGTVYEISLTATYACLHHDAAVNNAKIEYFVKKYLDKRLSAKNKRRARVAS